MKNTLGGFIFGALVGLVLSIICVQTIGYTAAIAMPSSIANLITGSAIGTIIAYLWEILIVQFIGAGIVALALTYAAIKFLPGEKRWKLFGIAVGALSLVYVSSAELLRSISLGNHLYGLVVLSCIFSIAFFTVNNKNCITNR